MKKKEILKCSVVANLRRHSYDLTYFPTLVYVFEYVWELS